jgi:RimJ/RimL family protein N-acetyltransferase
VPLGRLRSDRIGGGRIRLPGAPLRDGTTILRPWRESDIPALIAACQDAEIARWTRVPSPYGEAEARHYQATREAAVAAGAMAPFAIADADEEDRLLGSISLLRIAWEDARGEVGYWLAAEARGHGHATRAVRLICAWGFRQLGLGRIELLAASGNPASQRVAERTGFRREALLRSHTVGKHERQDMVAFGLLADEVTWG